MFKDCLDAVGFQPCHEALILLFISSVGIFIMYMRQPHTALTCTNLPRYLTSAAEWHLDKQLIDERQRALTSQGWIEIQARLTIPLFASRPRSPTAAVNSMTSKLVMLASWQTHFMTSILVTNSQCVKCAFEVF